MMLHEAHPAAAFADVGSGTITLTDSEQLAASAAVMVRLGDKL